MSTAILIDDSDWTFNLGLLWHISQQWSLGGFFRQGPDFRLQAESLSGPFLRNLGVPEGTVLESVESPIKFPSVFGAGVAFKTKNEALTFVAEWHRAQYKGEHIGIIRAALTRLAFKPTEGVEFYQFAKLIGCVVAVVVEI